eukprot:jgi/Chrzof1/12019/Cz06g18100.t1
MDPETDYGFGYQAYTDASSYAPVPPAPKPVPAAAPWPTYMVDPEDDFVTPKRPLLSFDTVPPCPGAPKKSRAAPGLFELSGEAPVRKLSFSLDQARQQSQPSSPVEQPRYQQHPHQHQQQHQYQQHHQQQQQRQHISRAQQQSPQQHGAMHIRPPEHSPGQHSPAQQSALFQPSPSTVAPKAQPPSSATPCRLFR